MNTALRTSMIALAVLGAVGACTEVDVAERRTAVFVEPGDGETRRVNLPDAGPLLYVTAESQGEFPRQTAFVDAGRDAECHDACPARCGEDEICCYTTGMCVPLDCWECCPDMGSRSRGIGHAAGEPP